MSQGQSIDPNMQRQQLQPSPQAPLQPQSTSPNILPSALPQTASPSMAPLMSKAPSMPIPAQGPYGTPSSRHYYPHDHPFSAAVRDMPVLKLKATGLGRGNSIMGRPPPQNASQGQSIDLTIEGNPSPTPFRPTQVLWPNYPPRHPSQPSGQVHSRLPPDGVARKAPRKSASSTTEALRSDGGADPAQRRASKLEHRLRRDTPGQQAISGRKSPAQGSALHSYHSGIKSLQAQQAGQNTSRRPSQSSPQTQPTATSTPSRSKLSAAARGRPIILDDDDDDDDGEYVDENVIIPSIEVEETSSPVPPATTARRPRRRKAPVQHAPPRPHLKYGHALPYGLTGMRTALGDDNWNEYCTLVERKILGRITEDEFTAQSKAIFIVARVVDERTTAKIERQVAKEVVIPMIREERDRAEEGYHLARWK